MSRYHSSGVHPESGKKVDVAWGWDQVPGFKAGYFFQVYNPDDDDLNLINEGFLNGISKSRLNQLKKEWKVKK